MKLIRMNRKIRPMKPVKKTDFIKNESVSFWTRFRFFLLYKILIFI